MGNKQQQYYLALMHMHEAEQSEILKSLNKKGLYEHNGILSWYNPVSDKTEPFSPSNLETKYNIVYDAECNSFVVIGEDEKQRRARNRKYRDDAVAQRNKNLTSKMQTDDKTLWVDVTGCAMRKEPWIKAFSGAPQMLARLTMLGCHLQRDTRYLMQTRRYSTAHMTRKDAAHILELNSKTFNEFWTYATEHGYIVGSDETGYELRLPVKYGELQDRNAQGHLKHESKLTQIMDTGVYERLYNRGGYICDDYSRRPLTPRDHHLVGKILQLTPYIHLNTNILCCNSLCSSANIEPLSNADISRLTGSDVAHSSRDVDRLCRITFPVGEKKKELQQYVLARVTAANGKTQYVVNPRLLCHAPVNEQDKIRTQISFVAFDCTTGEVT